MAQTEKRRVALSTLAVGSWCYPRSARPSGSFLRTQWRVARIDPDGTVLLKLGRASLLVSKTAPVLIDLVTES